MQAQPPDQMDRGPARAFLRHHPGARPDPRRRDRARRRDGRILGIKDVFLHDTGAYDPYGLTVPINSQCTLLGPYVVPNYDTHLHRRLHQQADRHALSRRRPPARRVRDRAAARHRRARARASTAPRSGGATSFRPMRSLTTTRSSTRISRRSNTTAAITSRCSTRRWTMIGYDDFIGEEQPRLRAARPPRRHRHRLLCRRHRHRPLRRRQGAGADERQGQRRDRHRHAGAGAFHRASRRSRPTSSASTSPTSMSSPATPTSSIGAPARLRAAAPWSPATPSTKRRASVRQKALKLAAERCL